MPPASEDGRRLLEAGEIELATQRQIEWINQQARTLGAPTAEDCQLLGVILFARKDFAGSARAFEQSRCYAPNWPYLAKNLGMALLLAGQETAALPELQTAHQRNPDDISVLDALAHVHGRLGQLHEARDWGEQALLRKDAEAGAPLAPETRWPHGEPLPAFDPSHPEQNVIAFSLFGALPRYTDGALANVQAAREHYPGWTCRFYIDRTVPETVQAQLRQAGVQIRPMQTPSRWSDALFWRFLVADDPHVQRFLVRDADSVLNAREAAAVRVWLDSPHPFHVMRDNPAHTDLMLAGMWGGVAGWLPPLPDMLAGFAYAPGTQARSADQLFLGARVWPRVRAHCLVHDRVFRCFSAQPFPAHAPLPPGRHVGDNAAAFR